MRHYTPDQLCDCDGGCYDCSVLGCIKCMAIAERDFGETPRRNSEEEV